MKYLLAKYALKRNKYLILIFLEIFIPYEHVLTTLIEKQKPIASAACINEHVLLSLRNLKKFFVESPMLFARGP